MTDHSHDVDLQALWQSQSGGEVTISLDEIRSRSRRLERIVARRNLREYVAAVIVTPLFGWTMWVGPSGTIRIGAALNIAAILFVVLQLYVRGSVMSLPADLALSSSLEFYRKQLERQRDLLRSVWSWALLPFVPGFLVLQIGLALALPARTARFIGISVVFLVLLVGLHALNRHVAARIQQRLDRLKENP
jgi:hypothetical protein